MPAQGSCRAMFALLALVAFIVGAVICLLVTGVGLLSLLAILFIGLAFLTVHLMPANWMPWSRAG